MGLLGLLADVSMLLLQRRKLQLQTRGLSDAGASQVIAGEPVSNPVDELMVSRALGRPPSPGV
jgi:hypothetical protein